MAEWLADVTVFYADGEPGDLQVVVSAATAEEAAAAAKILVERVSDVPAGDVGVNRVEPRP